MLFSCSFFFSLIFLFDWSVSFCSLYIICWVHQQKIDPFCSFLFAQSIFSFCSLFFCTIKLFLLLISFCSYLSAHFFLHIQSIHFVHFFLITRRIVVNHFSPFFCQFFTAKVWLVSVICIRFGMPIRYQSNYRVKLGKELSNEVFKLSWKCWDRDFCLFWWLEPPSVGPKRFNKETSIWKVTKGQVGP